MRILAIGVIIGAFLILSLYSFAIYYTRRRVLKKLYQPTTTIVKWSEANKLRDIYVSTISGKWSYDRRVYRGENINLWYGNWYSHRPVVLYLHGNSLNISYREYMAKLCSIMRMNVVLVDYRGYGQSDGKTTSNGILHDADTAMKFLLTQRRRDEIIVWGESLGGSPACYIASQYTGIKSLVLLSTFMSLHSLLSDAESTTRRLLFALAKYATMDINKDTNNAKFLTTVMCPVLIIHSTTDTLIPFRNAIGLVRSLPRDTKCILIKIEGDHDSPHFSEAAIRTLLDFVGAQSSSCSETLKLINSIGSKDRSLPNDIMATVEDLFHIN